MIRPRRSMLYMPGSNARALEKARTLAADGLILDLEDAVAPEAKAEARALLTAAVKAGGFGRREVIVRINALESEWGRADLDAVVPARPDAVLVPKIAAAADIDRASAELGRRDPGGGIALWAMMELPRAILAAGEIAARAGATRLAGFVMGTNDLAKELRVAQLPGRAALATALSVSVLAARAYGLAIIDGVHNDIQDTEGFTAVCRQGAELGFDGKTLIHPAQVETANRLFSPDANEVLWAREILAAFAEPGNRQKGVVKVAGRMVERLHAEAARRLVAVADAIAEIAVEGGS
jgi:citrate lyase subunit beta/citryl-CoA lyase